MFERKTKMAASLFVLGGVLALQPDAASAQWKPKDTEWPTYAADLAGSAVGCVLTIPILNFIHAPSAVILNSGIAALAAIFFALSVRGKTRWAAAARWRA